MSGILDTVKDKSRSPFFSLGELQEEKGVNYYIPSGMPNMDLFLHHDNDSVDALFRYGLATGRMAEIFGPSRSFKTYLCHMFSSQCLKMGGLVFYLSVEKDIDISFNKKVYEDNGVSLEEFGDNFAGTVVDTISDLKAQFKLIIEGVRSVRERTESKFPVLIVLDSYAMMFGDEELKNYSEAIDASITSVDSAKATVVANNHLFKNKEALDFYRYANKEIGKLDICFLFTNHIRSNVIKSKNRFGPAKLPVNNDTLEYFSDTRLSVERAYVDKISKDGKTIIGTELLVTVAKMRGKVINRGKFRLFYRHDHGFDYLTSLLEAMILSGLILVTDEEGRKIRFTDDIKEYDSLKPLLDCLVGKQVSMNKNDFRKHFIKCIREDIDFLSVVIDIVYERGPTTTTDDREVCW